MSIIINEATREHISYRYVSHSRSFPPVVVPLCQNNNIQVLEEEFPLHFLCNIWQAKKIFHISCESHVTALAKHFVKQGDLPFLLSHKKFEWACYIEI